MTDKWQCVKCKETKIQLVEFTILENLKEHIIPADIPKVMCHFHMMRNLTDAQYISENAINDSGARDENEYRK